MYISVKALLSVSHCRMTFPLSAFLSTVTVSLKIFLQFIYMCIDISKGFCHSVTQDFLSFLVFI